MKDFKEEIDNNTAIVGDFNTPLSTMDGSSRLKVNKDTVALKDSLDQIDLIDFYKTFHPKEEKYTFFSNAHGSFSKIDHMVGQKTRLNKFKKIEILSSIFFEHKGLKLETKLKKKHSKTFKYMDAE